MGWIEVPSKFQKQMISNINNYKINNPKDRNKFIINGILVPIVFYSM